LNDLDEKRRCIRFGCQRRPGRQLLALSKHHPCQQRRVRLRRPAAKGFMTELLLLKAAKA